MVELERSFVKRPLKELAEVDVSLIVELDYTFLKRPSNRTLVNVELRDSVIVELERTFVKRPLKRTLLNPKALTVSL